MEQRISFDYAFALLFLIALHGVSAFKVIAILYVNYQIATRLPRQHVPVATWVWNIGILFANELCEGYRFANIARHLSPPIATANGIRISGFEEWGRWLDSYGGIMSRWEVLFNITILRLISFNLDYYWSIGKENSDPVEVCPKTLLVRFSSLMFPRRNNLTLRTYLRRIASRSLRMLGISPFATMWHTPSMHHFTSWDPF
jgi:hypothetical protein